jgi:hypothetical protein
MNYLENVMMSVVRPPPCRRRVVVAALVLATFMGACRSADSPCDSSSKPAILLTVRDGVTSAPLHSGATIIADRHGDDTLTVLNINLNGAAIPIGSAAGIYDLRVIIPGYADWLTTNLTVAAEGCGPRTVGMGVFMQPSTQR